MKFAGKKEVGVIDLDKAKKKYFTINKFEDIND